MLQQMITMAVLHGESNTSQASPRITIQRMCQPQEAVQPYQNQVTRQPDTPAPKAKYSHGSATWTRVVGERGSTNGPKLPETPTLAPQGSSGSDLEFHKFENPGTQYIMVLSRNLFQPCSTVDWCGSMGTSLSVLP